MALLAHFNGRRPVSCIELVKFVACGLVSILLGVVVACVPSLYIYLYVIQLATLRMFDYVCLWPVCLFYAISNMFYGLWPV